MHDTQARILFVDDEPCMREMVAMLLSEEGYEVLTAVDGWTHLLSFALLLRI